MGMYRYYKKNVTFNEPLVLNSLNVPNRYIFNCERASKVESGGNSWFFDEFGPFLVFIPCLTEKIGKFQLVTSKFSALSGIKSNGR